MNLNEELQVEDGTKPTNEQLFGSLVGGLIYLIHTRFDITFSIGVILRFMHFSSKHHYGETKRNLCYVIDTVDYGIWYKYMPSCKLIGYINSDWGGCTVDRRSISRHLFSLGSSAIS